MVVDNGQQTEGHATGHRRGTGTLGLAVPAARIADTHLQGAHVRCPVERIVDDLGKQTRAVDNGQQRGSGLIGQRPIRWLAVAGRLVRRIGGNVQKDGDCSIRGPRGDVHGGHAAGMDHRLCGTATRQQGGKQAQKGGQRAEVGERKFQG